MGRRYNGEGTIVKRKDGRFAAAVTVAGKRKYVYARNREEAGRKLRELLKKKDDGIPILSDRQSAKEFLLSWLEAVRPSLRQTTWRRYSEYVRLHIIPEIGRLRLSQLTPQHVQRLYTRKLEQGLSPMTVRHMHAVLRKALGDATRWGHAARNVVALVRPPRVERREMMTLNPEQARAFLMVAEDERLEALYVLALATGMRQGELLSLRWKDVDLERGLLQVRSGGVERTKDGFNFLEPKTTRSRRQIILAKAAIAALKEHRIRQAEERLRLGVHWSNLDLVFANEVGKPLHVSTLVDSFRRILDRAELPRIRFHDLRHTYATLALQQGVHPKVVSDALGHANIAITLDTYSHTTPAMHRQAAEALDAILQR